MCAVRSEFDSEVGDVDGDSAKIVHSAAVRIRRVIFICVDSCDEVVIDRDSQKTRKKCLTQRKRNDTQH